MSVGIGTSNNGSIGIGTNNVSHSIVTNVSNVGIGTSVTDKFNVSGGTTPISGNLNVTGTSGVKSPWYKKIFGK